MAKHKHADLIYAWVDGAEIQFKNGYGDWISTSGYPIWLEGYEYRVKPQPKPDYAIHCYVTYDKLYNTIVGERGIPNVRYVFDGETNALKSAEVVK